MAQKLIQLNPAPASGGKLVTTELEQLLSDGWTVATDMCAAADGAVLIVLDPPVGGAKPDSE
jgi:hypothetical protein